MLKMKYSSCLQYYSSSPSDIKVQVLLTIKVNNLITINGRDNIIIMKQKNLKYYAQVGELLLWGVITGKFTISHTWHVPRGLSNFYIEGSPSKL